MTFSIKKIIFCAKPDICSFCSSQEMYQQMYLKERKSARTTISASYLYAIKKISKELIALPPIHGVQFKYIQINHVSLGTLHHLIAKIYVCYSFFRARARISSFQVYIRYHLNFFRSFFPFSFHPPPKSGAKGMAMKKNMVYIEIYKCAMRYSILHSHFIWEWK